MSTCLTFPASQSNRKLKRSSSRWRYMGSYGQNLEYWSPVCCTTVSQSSTLVKALIPHRILPAVACFFSRKQREKKMYGGNSAQIKRCTIPFISSIWPIPFQISHSPTLIFSLSFPGLPSCSGSQYPCILVRIQSPAELCRPLAPSSSISTLFRTKTRIVLRSSWSNSWILHCYVRSKD